MASVASSKACKSLRCNVKYSQYAAITDSGKMPANRSPAREKAFVACTKWLLSTGGRYEAIVHLDDIGSQATKHWFLVSDSAIKTDRLMTLIPMPPLNALEELPISECPKALMELLGSLQHPYVYPILDMGFYHTTLNHNHACLVMPFNPKGSLKDLIYKSQWNEPFSKKYSKKTGVVPVGLPASQVQRLGRQILEALLFLRDRGIPVHGHLHSGNVILQNGVARLSGLENELLGLSSRVYAVQWSHSASTDIENIDAICFGHLLYEMCTGKELSSPSPSKAHYQLDMAHYPQVAEALQMIFESPGGYPSLEEIVLFDLFRNIDLREMRGSCVPSFKQSFSLSSSTMSLLNAVRKRHTAFSEGSSPEGSSPRDRQEKLEELTTSDSEHNLDEIIIATIDSKVSPIHYCTTCDNGEQSSSYNQLDEKGTVIRISSFDDFNSSSSILQKQSSHSQCSQQSLDPNLYKNSKTRRNEYSMRGINLDNPSQDSAFGSMTDGELSRASSFKLSSFQSVSSPIDEEEDILEVKHGNKNSLCTVASSLKYIDSNSSSPCPETFTQSLNDLNNIPGPPISNPLHVSNIKETCIFLDPPKLIVNDGNYIYTSSPIRKCATSIFSQKYRVSSFEDMALISSNSLKSKNPFRSFEEEKRIECAFTPTPTNSSNDVFEDCLPIKHLSGKEKEKSTMWKDRFLKCNKNNITIKSNEKVVNHSRVEQDPNDDDDETSVENSSSSLTQSTQSSYRGSGSERLLFSLAKFKQNTLVESVALDTLSSSNKKLTNSSSSNDESNPNVTTLTSTTNDELYNSECSEEECSISFSSCSTSAIFSKLSIDDVKNFVKNFDSEEASNSEAAPLLEMQSLSSSSNEVE